VEGTFVSTIGTRLLLILMIAVSTESNGEMSVLTRYSPLYNTHNAFSYVAHVGQIAAVLMVFYLNLFNFLYVYNTFSNQA
jgi:undecaprenyl pyrophosphate phosphatase UppP